MGRGALRGLPSRRAATLRTAARVRRRRRGRQPRDVPEGAQRARPIRRRAPLPTLAARHRLPPRNRPAAAPRHRAEALRHRRHAVGQAGISDPVAAPWRARRLAPAPGARGHRRAGRPLSHVSIFPEGAIPTIPPVPEMGVTGGLLDVLGGAGTAQGVFEAGVETRIGVDKAIFDLQQGSENLSQQIQTQIGEVQLGFQQTQTNIADFFGGISEGFVTFFGGQQEPKIILDKDTVTQPPPTETKTATILQKKAGVFEPTEKIETVIDPVPFAVVTTAEQKEEQKTIITAEQPDLSLVSPFLTAFTEKQITLLSGEPTRGELRFGR